MPTDSVLYNAFITSAAELAEKGALEQINIYLTIGGTAAAVVIFFLGFLGYSQVRDIRTTLSTSIRNELAADLRGSEEFRRSIRAEIESDLLNSINRDIARIERLIDIGRLNALTQKIDESERFSQEDRSSILKSLINLKDDSAVNSSSEFLEALKLAVRSFFQAGLFSDLDQLDVAFQGVLRKSAEMSVPMLECYGLRALGEHGITEGDRQLDCDRMLVYVRSLMDLGFPEISTQYLVAYELWKNGKTERTDRLIKSCFGFTDEEKSLFLGAMRRGSDPAAISKLSNPKPYQIEFSEKFQAVVDEYAEELGHLESSVKV